VNGTREIYLENRHGPGAFIEGPVPLRGLSRVCFFVHGYNVDQEEADEAFDKLVEATRQEADVPRGTSEPSLDGAQAWRIYWPAYGRLGRKRWFFSPLSYPWHVADVEEWATALADRLSSDLESQDKSPVEVTFVGHSLGCRLILEVLRSKLYYRQDTWRVRLLFLMAAAVPVQLVEYDERLCRAARHADASQVAYSPIDPVLQIPFRIGQLLEGGLLPTAVGSSGQPTGLWSRQPIRTWNLHSGYFSDPLTALRLAEALGLHVPRKPEVRVVVRRPTVAQTILTSRPLARRRMQRHRIGG
jgi:Alpha/beta hydrolase of unknown function (DUF900)